MPKTSSKQTRNPHKSFRRTYSEEICDDYEMPGVMQLVADTFRCIFRDWKIYGGLILLTMVVTILFVGLLSEDSMNLVREAIKNNSDELARGELGGFASAGLLLVSTVMTGGLGSAFSDGQGLILVIAFLTIFLTSVYVVRYRVAGKKTSFRNAIYNAMTPAISCFVVLMVMLVELLPVVIVVIFYSSAVKTEFLATPFYALMFVIFAFFLCLLSAYLVSSSLVALVATTAPGVYPLPALKMAEELVYGRRMKLVARLLALFLIVAVIYVVVMLPVILIDGALKGVIGALAGVPAVSFFLLFCMFFSFIFASVYVYLIYRSLLDYKEE